MRLRSLILTTAVVCLSVFSIHAQTEGLFYLPFGAVHALQHKEPWALEHRFFNAPSIQEYGTVLLVPETADRSGMHVKTAATLCGAMHRLYFPWEWGRPPVRGEVRLDLPSDALGYHSPALWTQVHKIDESTVTGTVLTEGSSGLAHTYFAIRFSRPIKEYGKTGQTQEGLEGALAFPVMEGNDLSVCFSFDLAREQQTFANDGELEIHIAFSAVDTKGALQNLETEQAGKSFESLVWEMEQVWEQALSVVHIEDPGQTESQAAYKNRFYASLAESMAWPVIAQDADARYRGGDNSVRVADYHVHYQGFYTAGWAAYPLTTLLKPQMARQFAASVLTWVDQHAVGALPGIDFRKESVLLLTDAQAKDILPDSMVPLVTQVLEKTVANPYLLLIPKTRKLGFVPVEFAGAEVSLESTLDFSYVNWCFIRMASAMGNTNAVQATRPYVTAYQWLLDGKQGYARPRNEDLLFYNGDDSLAHKDALLYVPHNMEDVVDRARGRREYGKRLDQAEPFAELPYLYVWTTTPWKGQEQIREMIDKAAHRQPEEETPALPPQWFVFSSLGLYPLCPGTDQYVLGVPAFKKTTLRLEGGKELVIEAPQMSVKNRYVKNVLWNGKQHNKAYITHRELMQGGVLTFVMGPVPARLKTFRGENLPYSYLKK